MSAITEVGFEVSDLGPDGVLAALSATGREVRRLEAVKLELVSRWAVLHPATAETGVATHGGPALEVLTADESLGGAGTPAVAAFAPEDLAGALGVSPASAAVLLADVLDLAHRLPRLWARVRGLEVPAWQARRVAQATHGLTEEGAAWVDHRLATRLGGWGSVVVDRLVAQAVARFDPAAHAERERDAKASWHVRVHHPDAPGFAGTSDLTASGDTLDLSRFDQAVAGIADQLQRDGDDDPLGARRAKALGHLADLATRQPTLDLEPTTRVSPGAVVSLHVHVDAADLTDDGEGVASVERLGPVTLTRLRDWIGHHRVLIRPVLDLPGLLTRDPALDAHDPPDWLREACVLRDRHCAFPGCRRDARSCDLDHTIPYRHPDDGGPPGQTRPTNLTSLCRRHHRLKTLGTWTYTHLPGAPGCYLWTAPHHRHYLVTPTGTHTL